MTYIVSHLTIGLLALGLSAAYTSQTNYWDGILDLSCPSNWGLGNIYAYHWNKKEDRRYTFSCNVQVGPYR